MTAPVGTTVAFDAHTFGLSFSGTTFSHTVGSGSHRSIEAIVVVNSGGTASGVTYDGVAMTQVASTNLFGFNTYIFGLLNPPSGSHTVAITATDVTTASAASHSGVGSYGAQGTTSFASALGDAAFVLASSLDSGFYDIGGWAFGFEVEEGWGSPAVAAANGLIGVNLVGYSAPASSANFAGFF